MWLRPSFSQVTSNDGDPLVSRRDALMRCWYSCASVPMVTCSTNVFEKVLPSAPAGSGHEHVEDLAFVARRTGASARAREEVAAQKKPPTYEPDPAGVSSFTALV